MAEDLSITIKFDPSGIVVKSVGDNFGQIEAGAVLLWWATICQERLGADWTAAVLRHAATGVQDGSLPGHSPGEAMQ